MYCVLSALWIALTDKLVAQLHLPPQTVVQLSIAKGFLYVIVSGALIYAILKRLQEVNDNLESTVAARTAALEQKKEALKEQADLLRTFIDCAPVGLAMFDRNMCYIDVSKRWCKEYGLDRASILGKSQYSVFPDLPERWKEIHRRGLRGEVSLIPELMASLSSPKTLRNSTCWRVNSCRPRKWRPSVYSQVAWPMTSTIS
jgi:PAS domain-containing protein